MDVYAKQKAAFAARLAEGRAGARVYFRRRRWRRNAALWPLYMAACAPLHGGQAACGRCASCRKALAGGETLHPDIHVFEPEKNAGFSVETVRGIRKSVYLLPNEGDRKVYILCGAQKMSRSAQNALLKLFEEPPASASFVICCDRRDALLPTVLSRALLIPLGPLDDRTLRAYLADRHRDAPADRLDAAVRFAQGSIGRAASFLTPASQEASRAAADFCALLFAKGGAFALAAQALPLSAKRDGFDAFLAFVELYLLDVLHTHTGGPPPLLLAPSAAEEYRAGQHAPRAMRRARRALRIARASGGQRQRTADGHAALHKAFRALTGAYRKEIRAI